MYVKSGILPAYEQRMHFPDSNFSTVFDEYYGVHDDAVGYLADLIGRYTLGDGVMFETPPSEVADGTPMAPESATSLRQYARPIAIADMPEFQDLFNDGMLFNRSKHTLLLRGVIWEYCTTAMGEVSERASRPSAAERGGGGGGGGGGNFKFHTSKIVFLKARSLRLLAQLTLFCLCSA